MAAQVRAAALSALLLAAQAHEAAEGHEAHGEAHGAHSAHGGHHEHFGKIDIDSGCMLLGSVAFVMSIFQLVNVHDDDIRRYAWKVISNTISIFMAVLFFQGNNNMIVYNSEFYLGLSGDAVTIVEFLHCFVYVAALYIGVAYHFSIIGSEKVPDFDRQEWTIADAKLHNYEETVNELRVVAVINKDYHATKSIIIDDDGLEIPVEKIPVALQQAKRRSQAWSTLLAHMAGFSAIQAGGAIQQSETFRSRPLMSLIPVFITTGILLGVFQGGRFLRARMTQQAEQRAPYGPIVGKKDIRFELVTETMTEAEADVLALAISFLTTQVIRFRMTGYLPSAHGIELPGQFEPSWTHVLAICGWGIAFIFGSVALSRARPEVARMASRGAEAEEEEEEAPLLVKVVDVLMTAGAMVCAWCLFAAARLAWMTSGFLGLEVTSLNGRILLALALSFSCFGVVYVLDYIDDRSRDEKSVKPTIAAAVGAISVLVGFSWEHSFDGAVSAVVLLTENGSIINHRRTKFVLGLVVFAVLQRPWRKFILKRSMQLDDLKKVRDEKAKAKANPLIPPYPQFDMGSQFGAVPDPRGQTFLCCSGW